MFRLVAVGSRMDHFRRRVAVGGPVHLVLHGLEEECGTPLPTGRSRCWWR